MGFQLVLFAAIAIAIVIAIVLDYIRHKRIVAAEENSTQSSNEFKNLHEFLKHIFDGRVLEYNLNKITESDKAISKIRALQVKLRNSIHANEVDTLELAFKAMRPDRDIALQSMFFMKELKFYAEIVPAIELFQEIAKMPENEKIDAFVRHLSSRLSLNPNSKTADADAILLLENAKSCNFVSRNISDKFDKEETFACLKQLAKLHALWIAMRRMQPNLYYSAVNPHLHQVYEAKAVEDAIKETENFYDEHSHSAFPEMSANLRSAIEYQLEMSKAFFRNNERTPDTPYTTFYHRDIHISNFMTKRDEAEGKSIKVKILDFQGYKYNSFAFDLLQFLFYNVRIEDLKMHFKAFVAHYLSEFVNVMRIVNCPLDDYTNEKMWDEIRKKAKLNLFYLYMYLMYEKHVIEHFKLSSQHPTMEMVLNRWKCINELYIEHGFILID